MISLYRAPPWSMALAAIIAVVLAAGCIVVSPAPSSGSYPQLNTSIPTDQTSGSSVCPPGSGSCGASIQPALDTAWNDLRDISNEAWLADVNMEVYPDTININEYRELYLSTWKGRLYTIRSNLSRLAPPTGIQAEERDALVRMAEYRDPLYDGFTDYLYEARNYQKGTFTPTQKTDLLDTREKLLRSLDLINSVNTTALAPKYRSEFDKDSHNIQDWIEHIEVMIRAYYS